MERVCGLRVAPLATWDWDGGADQLLGPSETEASGDELDERFTELEGRQRPRWVTGVGDDCEHSLCHAPHLRELIFVDERYEQAWANQMIHRLVRMKWQVNAAKATGASV